MNHLNQQWLMPACCVKHHSHTIWSQSPCLNNSRCGKWAFWEALSELNVADADNVILQARLLIISGRRIYSISFLEVLLLYVKWSWCSGLSSSGKHKNSPDVMCWNYYRILNKSNPAYHTFLGYTQLLS